MRNLKRALSLALAAAMLISLMVVGASAASYGDADQVSQTEAVDVLTGLGVVGGDQNGNFNPTATLTRAEFCVMIANALTGGTFDRTLFDGASTPFTDVNGHWGAAYIAYCYSNGIIAGTSATTFSPDNTLTTAQAAAILLMALGYNQNSEFAANGQFELNVTKWARDAGLYAGMSVSATAGISRENTAKLIFNALTNTTPVGYNNLSQAYYTIGTNVLEGMVYSGDQLDPILNDDNAAAETRYTYTLGYTNFDLAKAASPDPDDFGRPCSIWGIDEDGNGSLEEDISTVANTPAVVFTAKTKAADVAKAIKGYTFDNVKVVDENTVADADGFTIGDLTASNGEKIATAVANKANGNGKLVEIFADSDMVVTDVVVVEYTVGEVTKITTNRDGDKTYTITNISGAKTDYADPDKADQIVIEGQVAVDDIVTFALANGKYYVYPTTSFTGAQSAYNAGKDTITVNGQTYTVATGVKKDNTNKVVVTDFGNSNDSGNTYYLDQYGFVVNTTAKAASTDYAYIVDAYGRLDSAIDGKTPYVEIRAVLADGTVGVYEVAVEEKNGNWFLKGTNETITTTDSEAVQSFANDLKSTGVYAYTLDGSVMTLEILGTTLADGSTTLVGQTGSYNIVKNNTAVTSNKGTVLMNKDLTIVIYDDDNKAAKVVTGTDNLGSTVLDSYKAVVSGNSGTLGTATIVFDTVSGGVVADSSNYVFIDTTKYSTILDGSTEKYVYTGYLPGGDTLDLTATAKLSGNNSETTALFRYTDENTVSNTDLISYTAANVFTSGEKVTWGRMLVTGDMMKFFGGSVYYDISEANVIYIDGDLSEINDNAGWVVLKTDNGNITSTVETIYVVND